MGQQQATATRRSEAAKRSDGCISTARAAGIAGCSEGALRYWVRHGLVKPTRTDAQPGTGVHARYDLRDVIALRAIADLRRRGASLQTVRKVQEQLRAYGVESFASCRLAAIQRGKTHDVLLVRSAREVESLIEVPGQLVVASILLGPLERETARQFAAAMKLPPLKRGRKPMGLRRMRAA